MKCNVGGMDRAARLTVGVVLLLVGFFAPIPAGWQIIVFILAAVALVTGLARYCPLNAAIGLDTCPSDRKETRAEAK